MGLRDRLRRLEERAAEGMGSFELKDGTVYRYGPEEFMEALCNFFERVRAEDASELDSGVHPFIAHLRRAKEGELERLIREEGSLVQLMVVKFQDSGLLLGHELRSPSFSELPAPREEAVLGPDHCRLAKQLSLQGIGA